LLSGKGLRERRACITDPPIQRCSKTKTFLVATSGSAVKNGAASGERGTSPMQGSSCRQSRFDAREQRGHSERLDQMRFPTSLKVPDLIRIAGHADYRDTNAVSQGYDILASAIR
jgi:hypothetical protein